MVLGLALAFVNSGCYLIKLHRVDNFLLYLFIIIFLIWRVNTCPNNCSGRGECRVGNSTASVYCECEVNWKGDACDIPYCQNDCGYPERGQCQEKTCICKAGWQGELASLEHCFGFIFINHVLPWIKCFIKLTSWVSYFNHLSRKFFCVNWAVALLTASWP